MEMGLGCYLERSSDVTTERTAEKSASKSTHPIRHPLSSRKLVDKGAVRSRIPTTGIHIPCEARSSTSRSLTMQVVRDLFELGIFVTT